jgi:hypothetical protein
MPNSKHLTHGISNLVSLITKTKLGLSALALSALAGVKVAGSALRLRLHKRTRTSQQGTK